MTGYEGADVRPAEPAKVDCGWCSKPSVEAVSLRGKPGQFMYACRQHLEIAHRANQPKERKKK